MCFCTDQGKGFSLCHQWNIRSWVAGSQWEADLSAQSVSVTSVISGEGASCLYSLKFLT